MQRDCKLILEFANGNTYNITFKDDSWYRGNTLLDMLEETTIVGVKVIGTVSTEIKTETSFKVHAI